MDSLLRVSTNVHNMKNSVMENNLVVVLAMFLSCIMKAHPHDGGSSTGAGPACGTTALDGPNGSFTSPNYPDKYYNSEWCVWEITVQQGWFVELTIENYDIEENSECSYDKLEVFDGLQEDSELASLCGLESSPTVLISSSNMMRVAFTTDRSVREKGFSAKYREIPCADPKELKQNGDLEWFKFKDEPQTSISNLENALYTEVDSTEHYVGLSKKDVIFHVEAQSGNKFRFFDLTISTRFASEIVITYEFMKKKSILKEGKSESITDTKEWTTTYKLIDVKNVKSITVTAKWDTSLGKKMKKINVKDFKILACEQ